MRYQNQQKGLFTFYKEQQLYQSQLQLLKKRKKEVQIEAQNSKMDKKIVTSGSYPYNRFSPEKYKSSSQPALNEQQSMGNKKKNANIQKIGNSVIIINRKGTQNGDERNYSPTKEISYQQRGYFLENKKIEFEQLQKFKNSNIKQSQHRKKSLIRKKLDYLKSQESNPRNQTKLPNISKIQENSYEQIKQNPSKNRIVGSSLRFYGGQLMKYIRGNIASDIEVRNEGLKKEVSFIEISANYSRENSSKKMQQLNEQQKKLLQILHRYRQPDI